MEYLGEVRVVCRELSAEAGLGAFLSQAVGRALLQEAAEEALSGAVGELRVGEVVFVHDGAGRWALGAPARRVELPPLHTLLPAREAMAPVALGLAGVFLWLPETQGWYELLQVVRVVSDEDVEISLHEARQLDEGFRVGDEVLRLIAEAGEMWGWCLEQAWHVAGSGGGGAG